MIVISSTTTFKGVKKKTIRKLIEEALINLKKVKGNQRLSTSTLMHYLANRPEIKAKGSNNLAASFHAYIDKQDSEEVHLEPVGFGFYIIK